MADAYQWWRDALEGNVGPIHDDNPQCGFFRKKNGKGPDAEWIPVAIFPDPDTGEIIALSNNRPVDAGDVWTWVAKNPVEHDAYERAIRGEGWADDAPKATIGHNSGSTDPHEALTIELAGEREMAEGFLKQPIKTKDDADKAAVWSKRLSAIAKKATDLHKVEKQPALDECRRIDDKWRDLKDGAADLAKSLKRHLDEYLREQDRLEQERRRKAEEEARRQREAAEAAARAAANDEAAKAEAERLRQQADEAEKAAQARNASAGRTGAKVALRTFVSAKIVDYDKALLALKDHPEMKELVQTLANRAVKAGVAIEGVERHEDRRAA